MLLPWVGNAVDAAGGAGIPARRRAAPRARIRILGRGTPSGNVPPRAAPPAASPVRTGPRPCLPRRSLLGGGRPSPACRSPPRLCLSVKQSAGAPRAGERPPCRGFSRLSSLAGISPPPPKATGLFGKAMGGHGDSRALCVGGRPPPGPALPEWGAATRPGADGRRGPCGGTFVRQQRRRLLQKW